MKIIPKKALSFDDDKPNIRRFANLTPLIDMMFLLVVFFMLTTSFDVIGNVEFNVKSVSHKTEQGRSNKGKIIKRSTIKVLDNRTVKINGNKVEMENLYKTTADLIAITGNKKFILQAEVEAKLEDLVYVTDELTLAGAKEITFDYVSEMN